DNTPERIPTRTRSQGQVRNRPYLPATYRADRKEDPSDGGSQIWNRPPGRERLLGGRTKTLHSRPRRTPGSVLYVLQPLFHQGQRQTQRSYTTRSKSR